MDLLLTRLHHHHHKHPNMMGMLLLMLLLFSFSSWSSIANESSSSSSTSSTSSTHRNRRRHGNNGKSWSLEAYCTLERQRVLLQEETILTQLSESSRQFLQDLNLSFLHPFCESTTATSSTRRVLPVDNTVGNENDTALPPPPMGPLQSVDFTIWEHCVNGWYHVAPPLLAMSELWLRLLASVLAPLCAIHVMWKMSNSYYDSKSVPTTTTTTTTMKQPTLHDTNGHRHHREQHDSHGSNNQQGKTSATNGSTMTESSSSSSSSSSVSSTTSAKLATTTTTTTTIAAATATTTTLVVPTTFLTTRMAWICMLGVASSVVLLTDTLYVLEFGPRLGMTWLIVTSILAILVVVVYGTNNIPQPPYHHHQHSPIQQQNGHGTTNVQHPMQNNTIRLLTAVAIVLLWCLTLYLTTKHHYEHINNNNNNINIAKNNPWFSFGNVHDAVTIQEGFYYHSNNSMSTRIAQHMIQSSSSLMNYSQHATPWMPTGDSRTGLPFLLNQGTPTPKWIRVWLPVPTNAWSKYNHKTRNRSNTTTPSSSSSTTTEDENDDNVVRDHLEDNDDDDMEYVALDIAFPVHKTGFDPSQPVYLLLHGLNGGSQEEFVKDFTNRRTGRYYYHHNKNPSTTKNDKNDESNQQEEERATVVVMVARGLMDLPIRGWNVFHGARTSDVHEAAGALQRVVHEPQPPNASRRRQSRKKTVLAGVGYSMGAIILSNYVGRYGTDCPLDVAVAISGGLDMRQVITFYRAQRLWQPMITTNLRHAFVVDKWGERVRARLTRNQLIRMLRSTHITEIDEYAVVAYNGFDSLIHYYSEMSLLGDIPLDEYDNPNLLATNSVGKGARVHNISVPLLVIHALDDPLITWRTVASNHGFMHPSSLSKTGSGNLFLLLTKAGGHVGWPMGWMPHVHGWKWMNNVPKQFVDAVIQAKESVVR